MKLEDLVGVWELVYCEGESKDDRRFLPYGREPIGRLMYDKDGAMSVLLMARDRNKFASEDISKATSAEVKNAFESFDAYSGRWNFDAATQIVEHHIECGRIPNWVGRIHRRACEMDDANLILRTEEFEMMGAKWIVSVAWRRLQNKH